MNKEEFVYGILTFFGKQENQALLEQYNKALETYKKVDWNKLYKRSIDMIQDRKLPMPSWFRSQFDYCIKGAGVQARANDGNMVYVELNNGLSYEYELYNCSKTQAEIRKMLNDRFTVETENGKKCNVKQIYFLEEYGELLKFKHKLLAGAN